MSVRLKRFLVTIIVLLSLITFVQEKMFSQYNEYEIKAAMIGKFTLFVDWPKQEINKEKSFNLCVLGKSPITKYLELYYKKIKLKNLPVIVKELTSSPDINSCKLLFISSNYKKDTENLFEKIKKRHILTVGDNDKFISTGAHICFYLKDDVVRFKINYKLMRESDLKVSYLLLNVGEVVEQ